MNAFALLETMSRVGAIITNSHIVYTSGKHGDSYVNKDALYPHTAIASQLCETIARQFMNSQVDVVCAPAIGGVILSQWTAHHLSALTGREVLSIYAEKSPTGDDFMIKRGYDALIEGKRVLVVEDVLTTGGSVRKVIQTARAIGATVVGVGALCNRGGLTANDLEKVPSFFPLLKVDLAAWEAKDCPLCAKGIPINTSVGKGKEFIGLK